MSLSRFWFGEVEVSGSELIVTEETVADLLTNPILVHGNAISEQDQRSICGLEVDLRQTLRTRIP